MKRLSKSISGVKEFQVYKNNIFIKNIDDTIANYSLVEYNLIYKLQKKFSFFLNHYGYLIGQLKNKSGVKIYNKNGKLIIEIDRFPFLYEYFIFKNNIMFSTSDQLRNQKKYWTEIDLEKIDVHEWLWIHGMYDKLELNLGEALLITKNAGVDSRIFFQYAYKITGKELWRVYLEELNPDWSGYTYREKIITINNKLIIPIGDLLVCLDAQTGKILWKTDNLGFPSFNTESFSFSLFHYWKDKAFIIPRIGDYIVVDLKNGREIIRIKNWSEGIPYNPHFSRWTEKIKIYDDFIMIPDIEIGSNLIHFFDKQTGKERYKFELGKVLRWDKENLEYINGKLYVKTSDKEEGPFTLKIFELNLEKIL